MPDIEALIMLRPTASFGRYRQWVGRALRPSLDKAHAILIDHVGNIPRHGLPDADIDWRIDRAPQQQRTNLIDCAACHAVVAAWLATCPHCGSQISIKERRQIGGFYVDQRIIDFELCESMQQRARAQALFETEIQRPSASYGSDLVGRTVARVVDWISRTIEQQGLPRSMTIGDANRFLSGLTREHVVRRYTINDIKTDNTRKIYQELRRWHSKSAAQTPARKAAALT